MSDTDPAAPDRMPRDEAHPEDDPEFADLYDELQELEQMVDTHEAREQVRDTMRMALEVNQPGVFGKVITGFGRADLAEAFLGSLIFGLPMFVESGTLEIGEFIATHPAFLVGTHLLAVGIVIGILYVADIQDVQIHEPFFGVIPRRMVGVLGISLVTALVLMTGWGRVAWADPWLAFCQVTIAYLPMAIGAALGDIVPGT